MGGPAKRPKKSKKSPSTPLPPPGCVPPSADFQGKMRDLDDEASSGPLQGNQFSCPVFALEGLPWSLLPSPEGITPQLSQTARTVMELLSSNLPDRPNRQNRPNTAWRGPWAPAGA